MDDTRQRLKAAVIEADRGPFIGWWEHLLTHDPGALARIHALLSVAEREPAVPERLRHLIWTAVDAVVTHLFPRGIGVHADIAMTHGATVRQVVEALEISAAVSSRGFGVALPILLDALGETTEALDAGQSALKEHIAKRLGYWAGWMDAAIVHTPDYLARLAEIGASDEADDGLDAKSRVLIFLACAACPAIVDRDAIRQHATHAVVLGATKAELIQVVQLANCIGIHPVSTGITATDEHLSKVAASPNVAARRIA